MIILFVHFIATLFMVGLIWFVQIVHYPLFLVVGKGERRNYCLLHTKKTSIVVLPPMLIELATGIFLWINEPGFLVWILNIIFLVIIWLSTFLFQVPEHRRLIKSGEDQAVRRLVFTNWIRTFFWTARAVLLSLFLVSLLFF